MPKIQRKTQKIFCNSADSDQLAVFGSMATGAPVYSNDVEQLQSNEAYNIGWDAATLEDKAPFMEEMNGMQYSLSYQTAYLLQQGIPEWDEGTEYCANTSFCQVNGVIYQSTTDNNIGNNPVNDTTNWAEFGFSAYVKKSGDTMTGNLTISKTNTSDINLQATNLDYTSTTAPSANTRIGGVLMKDENGKVFGAVENYVDTSNRSITNIYSRRSVNGTEKSCSIKTYVDSTGSIWTQAPTPATGDNSTKIATTAFVNTLVPAGTIVSSGSSSTPTGYLYCNGSAVSRTTYAKLFNAIGTTYGTGDGSTTFNLPNFTNYKFVTSATVSVKGNGKAIGITDGTNNYGLGSGTAFLTAPRTQNYGQDVGVSLGATAKNFDSTIGLTTDASKSGITATASTATIKWYIKY